MPSAPPSYEEATSAEGLKAGAFPTAPAAVPLHPSWAYVDPSKSPSSLWRITGRGGLTWKTGVGGSCPERDALNGCCRGVCGQRFGVWRTVLRTVKEDSVKRETYRVCSQSAVGGDVGNFFQRTMLGQRDRCREENQGPVWRGPPEARDTGKEWRGQSQCREEPCDAAAGHSLSWGGSLGVRCSLFPC